MPNTLEQPPRKWLKVCDPYWINYSDKGAAMRAAVAKENDPAEALGFECVPDNHRGFGYCKFRRASDRVQVWSVWLQYDHRLYPWARGQFDSEGSLLPGTLYYNNFEDALHDRNPRLRRTHVVVDRFEVLK